jgi:Fur family transcriptional regulator, ferric uptake regulator
MSRKETFLRNTKQRDAILHALDKAGRPLLPAEVLEEALKVADTLGIATVYRTLNVLLESGQVTLVYTPNGTRYELSGLGHHHHFLCNTCDKMFEIDGCAGNLKTLLPKGFSLENHDLTLYGQCRDCKSGV